MTDQASEPTDFDDEKAWRQDLLATQEANEAESFARPSRECIGCGTLWGRPHKKGCLAVGSWGG
jgi:hypothetical protein